MSPADLQALWNREQTKRDELPLAPQEVVVLVPPIYEDEARAELDRALDDIYGAT